MGFQPMTSALARRRSGKLSYYRQWMLTALG